MGERRKSVAGGFLSGWSNESLGSTLGRARYQIYASPTEADLELVTNPCRSDMLPSSTQHRTSKVVNPDARDGQPYQPLFANIASSC